MKDELKAFLQKLENGVMEVAQNMQNRELAFTDYVLGEIADKIDAKRYNISYGKVLRRDNAVLGEIYGYNESSNGEVLTLFYTIYDSLATDEVKTIPSEVLQRAFVRLQGFYEQARNGIAAGMSKDNALYEAAALIAKNWKNYYQIKLCILSNCAAGKTEIRRRRIDSKDLSYDVWDLRKLCDHMEGESDHEIIDLSFGYGKDYNYTIPYIKMVSDMYDYECVIAMFPAKLLYHLYKKYNTRLLISNVRYFLGFKKTKKNHTNMDIKETLTKEGQMFLAYNNGVTAIASDVVSKKENSGIDISDKSEGDTANEFIKTGIIEAIKDFQIVNGGQTTANIFKTKEGDQSGVNLNGVFVQIKIIVIPKGRNAIERFTLASNVTRSSNTQNQVRYSDYSVNNSFNLRMQQLSELLYAETDKREYWFYERVRGQYKERQEGVSKADQGHFKNKYPEKNKFDKRQLAFVWNCWKHVPNDAVKGVSYDNFIEEIENSQYIPDENYFKETIGLLIIYRYLRGRSENLYKYKGCASVVQAYTIAYLHYFTGSSFDLLRVWERQQLTAEQQNAIGLLADAIHLCLVSLAGDEPIINVAKRKNTFKDLTMSELEFDPAEVRKMLLADEF